MTETENDKWESHGPNDHPPLLSDAYIRTWRQTFYAFSPMSQHMRVVGTILAAHALEDGTCIHLGNGLLDHITGYHPRRNRQAMKRLQETGWIVKTHEATSTTPHVFSLNTPEAFL